MSEFVYGVFSVYEDEGDTLHAVFANESDALAMRDRKRDQAVRWAMARMMDPRFPASPEAVEAEKHYSAECAEKVWVVFPIPTNGSTLCSPSAKPEPAYVPHVSHVRADCPDFAPGDSHCCFDEDATCQSCIDEALESMKSRGFSEKAMKFNLPQVYYPKEWAAMKAAYAAARD